MFKTWEPDPYALIFGTGYMRFTTELGLDGLARISGDRLDILAIVTDTPGNGQFREFIRLAKEQFKEIGVWHVWNDALPKILTKYGFYKTKTVEMDGEILEGYLYEHP